MSDLERFGFEPQVRFQVAGVTMVEGRQDVLKKASALVWTKTLTKANGGVQLIKENNNPFDQFAVGVWIAAGMEANGQFKDRQLVGYLPKRVCWKCFHSWGGSRATVTSCPSCKAPTVEPRSNFNVWVASAAARGVQINYAVRWISQAEGNVGSWGCQMVLTMAGES